MKREEDKQIGTIIAGVKLYTVNEVAYLVGVVPQTIRSYIKKGRLKHRKIGRNIFCSETDLRHFANATQKPKK